MIIPHIKRTTRKGFTPTPKFFGVSSQRERGFTPTPKRGVTSCVFLAIKYFFASVTSEYALHILRRRKNTTPRLVLGFTLIELLVVIAIIAMLATIVLGTLGGARQQARDSKRLADLKQLQSALELYASDNRDKYPTALSGLVTGGYIAVAPLDPSGGSYSFAALGSGTNCTRYHLGATLENIAHAALSADFDATAGTACTGSALDFAGADPVYDLKP